MKLNEVYHLIIYCLNCIRHDQNSTYKTGLRNICNELESSIIYTSTFSKTAELDQGLKGNDNDMQVTFNMHVRLWCESPIKICVFNNNVYQRRQKYIQDNLACGIFSLVPCDAVATSINTNDKELLNP